MAEPLIGLDCRLIRPDAGGVGAYQRYLAQALVRSSSGLRFRLYHDGGASLNGLSGDAGSGRALPWPSRLPEFTWCQGALPWSLRRDPVDLFHATNFFTPLLWPGSQVVTVHDLAFEFFPDDFAPTTRRKYRLLTRAAVRRAARIIAPSKHTKSAIVETYDVPEERVRVVYHGAPPFGAEGAPAREVPQPAGTDGRPFLLFVGEIRPRKNLRVVLEALSRLQAEYPELRLVVAGRVLREGSDPAREARFAELKGRVVHLGYVDRPTLENLYRRCLAFVFPSLLEGFGLAALEALSCGAAVIAAGNSSLPEVCGPAALYFNPKHPDELADRIAALASDQALGRRLRSQARARASLFTWDRAAEETIAVYREALT